MEPTITYEVMNLLGILTFKRGHNSKGEAAFIAKYLPDFQTIKDDKGEVMAFYYQVDGAPTLWSCHIDTVHNTHHGEDPVQIEYDPVMELAYVKDAKTPLGADDGVGFWLLREMMAARVPGTYIFHRGEECGGIGSSWLADHYAHWLQEFKHAIAFDRKGNNSIITHQGSRGCSDTFGLALADALNQQGMDYQLDDGGVFTDTANYFGLISECTNVSCGYMNEHKGTETLDVNHALALRNALIAAFKDGINLPAERTPEDRYSHGYRDYGADWRDRYSYSDYYGEVKTKKDYGYDEDYEDQFFGRTVDEIAEFDIFMLTEYCTYNPDEAAELLYDLLADLKVVRTQ